MEVLRTGKSNYTFSNSARVHVHRSRNYEKKKKYALLKNSEYVYIVNCESQFIEC